MNAIINRIVFVYTAWDICKEISHCVCCRKLKTKKDIQYYRQQYLYNKAKKKLEQNFDALSLIRFMNQMQLLAPVLLDQN
jgi:hypothetical protein